MVAKDLRDAFPFARFNSGIEVDELPSQTPGEFRTHRTLS
jgi:hypothetical protein